jgi:3-deoxy-D-manno-octulosonic acid kinase
MKGLGLPVPDAVAARVETSLLCYRADLITVEIENIKTLSDALTSGALSDETWKKIGFCVKSFHLHDVYHADLNARNILIEETGRVYLIDFDNSYVRTGSKTWKTANLARLKRSLLKFKGNTDGFNFSDPDWLALLEGYETKMDQV